MALNDLIKAMRKDLYGKEDKKMHDVYFLKGVLKYKEKIEGK